MATATSIVITFDDGTTQTVSAAAATETIATVDVVNTDGTSETFTPEQAVEAAPEAQG